MTERNLLEMRGIHLRYGPTVALDGVDFTLQAGEIHALLGENGAGKSSLMQILAGAVRPDRGSMVLDGVTFAPSSPAAAQRAGVAMVFQELTLLGHLTIAENLGLGREPRRLGFVDRRARRQAAERVLARLARPGLDPDRRVASLPPADRQIVEIARALLAGARVLVLDEPTSSLGEADARQLFVILAQLRREGLGIVFISHALEEVRRICDRCTVLRDGHTVATAAVAATDDPTLVRHMAGRPLDQVFPAAGRPAGAVVLDVEDLAGAPLPRRASLQLAAGQIAGIGGLAGAGRTELLQAIFGLRARCGGAVRLRGEDLPADPGACWRAGVGYGAEDRKQDGLSLRLSIAANVVLPHLRPVCAGGLLRWSRVFAAAQRLGERVSLKCRSPRQAVRELSGGNQQKVAFARLLHAGCDVLLLDEPTRGIDVGSRQEVYQLLDGLARGGAAILVVSSQLPELLGLCDRIAVMRKGVLSAFRPAADWTQETLLHEMMVGEQPQECPA